MELKFNWRRTEMKLQWNWNQAQIELKLLLKLNISAIRIKLEWQLNTCARNALRHFIIKFVIKILSLPFYKLQEQNISHITLTA